MPIPPTTPVPLTEVWGIPLTVWCTALGAVLAIGAGFLGKLLTEFRDNLAKDRQTFQEMHKLLGELGACIHFNPNGVAEAMLGKTAFDLDYEFRMKCFEIRCRWYRNVGVEAMSLGYDDNDNVVYMISKLRSKFNPKLDKAANKFAKNPANKERIFKRTEYLIKLTEMSNNSFQSQLEPPGDQESKP